MSTSITPFPALTIAALPHRLEADAYPLHTSLRVRWSDIQEDRVSRVAMAHFFEDLRIFALHNRADSMIGSAMLRAVTIEHLAPASLDFPYLDMAAGVASIGKTSFTYALAAFQNGRCIAVGSAVDVRIANGQPTPWDENMRAMLQQNLMPDAAVGGANTSSIQPNVYSWSFELHTRFADTDTVGHLNNVSMFRYHDNAAMAFIRDALGYTRPDPQGRRLSVIRQDLSLGVETHFPEPITLSVAVLEIQPLCFTLALATDQGDRRTTTSTAVVAWVDQQGNAQPLPLALVEKLHDFRVPLPEN